MIYYYKEKKVSGNDDSSDTLWETFRGFFPILKRAVDLALIRYLNCTHMTNIWWDFVKIHESRNE